MQEAKNKGSEATKDDASQSKEPAVQNGGDEAAIEEKDEIETAPKKDVDEEVWHPNLKTSIAS